MCVSSDFFFLPNMSFIGRKTAALTAFIVILGICVAQRASAQQNIPPAPTLSGSVGKASVALSWNAVAYATQYYVYQSMTNSGNLNDGTWTLKDITTNPTDGFNAENNVTQYYYVKGYNGNQSQPGYPSNVVALTPVLGTVTISARPTGSPGVYNVTWSVAQNADSYSVWDRRGTSGGFSMVSTTISPNATVSLDNNPPAGLQVFVEATNDNGTYGETQSNTFTVDYAWAPPPPWCAACALDSRSSSDALGPWGPLWPDPVDLMNGAEINAPAPDLTVYNPSGPSVSFQRNYRSDRALANESSPGLSAGWADNYDISIIPNQTSAWGPLTLVFDNGAIETLTPPNPPTANSTSVPITVPAGAPQIVTGDDTNGVTGVWKSITVTMDDSSQWVFTSPDLGASYVLTQIISRTGRKLDLQYSSLNFGTYLSKFVDDATGTVLAQLNYNADDTLANIQDKVGGREVDYGYTTITGPTQVRIRQSLHGITQAGGGALLPPVLYTVSEVSSGGGGANRYTYGYETVMGEPLLSTTTVPDPTSGNGTGAQTATITYNDTTGQVTKIVDAYGNQSLYTYPSMMSSTVEVKDKNGNHILGWTQNFDGSMRNSGTTDANGNSTVISYGDGNNPLKPTSVTTPATGPGDTPSHTTTTHYDAYGHVTSVTSPRGVITTYTYKYDKFALGRLMSVQETASTNSKQATSFTYFEPSGLVNTVTSPAPGSVFGGNTPEVTSTLTYDLTLGNLVKVVAPGNNAASTVTTTYNYTTDGSYTTTAAIGEPLTVTDPNGNVTHYRYDAQGLVRKVIDAMGNETDFDYAPTGQSSLDEQLEKITYPATGLTGTGQAYTTYAYQYPGGPLASVSEYDEGNAGRVRLTLYGYGKEGELLSASGSTEPVAYTYDPLYRVSTLTDGGGHTTSYYYDTQVGNLNGVTYPGYTGPAPVLDANHNYSNIAGADSVLYKTYDNADDATAIVDGRGDTTTYAYADPEYLPTSVSYTVPVGSPATALAGTSYGYDWDGRLSTRTDASGGFSFGYDDLDGLTSKTTTYLAPTSGSLPAWSLSYAYYPDGSRKTMTLASGGTNYVSTYTYDKGGRITGLVNPNNEKTTWGYQANDWLTAQTTNATSSTPVETTYSYYARGWMQELKTTQGLQGQGLTPTLIADFAGSGGSTPSMTYDALGNRASLTASGFPTGTGTFNGLTSFVYDARDELTSESSQRDAGYTSALVYDGVTMNTTTGPGDATSERSVGFTYDSHGDNQIASDSGHYSWTYDGDGNPVTYLSKVNAFDPENRMTAYGIPTGGGHASLTMGYDDDGMRAWKENSSSNRTYFLYDGSDIIAELTSTGTLGTYQTVGADGVVSRHAGTTTTYYAFDPSGNVSAVLSSSGGVRGDELFEANGHADSSYRNRPVDFGGQWGYYADSETGLTLLGHRYYDSYAGRFLTRDPIGYNGGVNLYGYTANNFENEIDPDGTDYFGDVGQVFAGYGDVLNPFKIADGVAKLAQIAGGQGFGAAGIAFGNGVYHGLTDWMTTDDPRKFGQSFGTTLIVLSPLIKRIPNPLPYTIEGPWLTPIGKIPTGATFFKISKTNVSTEAQVCRFEIGKLDVRKTMSPRLQRRFLPHWHRRGPGGIGRQRPWENGGGGFWERF